MMGPHWNPKATEIGIVLQGKGMVRVVCPSLLNQAKCKNARFGVEEGDVFAVRRFHPMAQMAFNNETLAFIGFSTSMKNNHPQYLAGKASVLRTLDKHILATSFGVNDTTFDGLLNQQRESVILECNSCAEEEWRLMEEEIEREREEARRREEEEARRKEEERIRQEEEAKRREKEERKKREQEEGEAAQERKEQEERAREEWEKQQQEKEAQKRKKEEEEREARQREEKEAQQRKEQEERQQAQREAAARREEEAAKQEEAGQRKQWEAGQRGGSGEEPPPKENGMRGKEAKQEEAAKQREEEQGSGQGWGRRILKKAS